MLPTIAVTIPIALDHFCTGDSLFEFSASLRTRISVVVSGNARAGGIYMSSKKWPEGGCTDVKVVWRVLSHYEYTLNVMDLFRQV